MSQSALDLLDQNGATMQGAVNEASSEAKGQFKKIKYPGKYCVEVKDLVMPLKEADAKTGLKKKFFPGLNVAGTGTIMVDLILTTTTDVGPVSSGSDTYFSFPFMAAANAPEDKIKNVARFMKPTVATLTGITDIIVSGAFAKENLLNDYDANDKVTRRHKMTNKYYIDVDVDPDKPITGKGEWNLKVISIVPWADQPLSVNVVEPNTAPVDVTAGSAAGSGGVTAPSASAGAAADIGPGDATTASAAVPNVDDDLPF